MAKAAPAVQTNQVGVIGGGTMGSGIALVALLADLSVVLYDVQEEILQKAREYIEKHLQRKQRAISIKYLTTTSSLEDLRGCGFVIEAAPESLTLKKDLFSRLGEICPPPAILTTNTSTLPVTAIAAADAFPERVGGMHFFNPAPVMPLIEIIRGAATSSDTVRSLARLAEKMGKTPVVAGDTPGFIVNRVARPYYGEALRLLGEGVASHESIDRVMRFAAGFRMGPFELMDLIGIDINYAATQSVFEQTFGEPRYRPHVIQSQMVHQGALGRKTGRGFYTYDPSGKQEERQEREINGEAGKFIKGAYLVTQGSWAPGLKEALQEAGMAVESEVGSSSAPAAAIVAAGRHEGMRELLARLDLELPPDVLILCQCADTTLAEASNWIKHRRRLAGFDGLFAGGSLLTLTATAQLSDTSRGAAENLAGGLGKEAVWIQDAPALIAPRIVCMLANEAAFAAGEGVAEPETIDRAMQLGTNYPKGPLAWAKEIGYDRVVAVLEHLRSEYGEERYRIAPLLRRWMRQSLS